MEAGSDLANQCWKDSWDSIACRDGNPSGVPARDLRAPAIRLRREGPRGPTRSRRVEGRRVRGAARFLWSGIVDKSKAKACANLMGPRLFSGWGIRTMAEGEGRYNPIGYHVGTVWPFDSSFAAWGLRRYGYKEEAARIAAAILDAARFFLGRLPEAFGGYSRAATKDPVQYPTSCSPQAWSTRAPCSFSARCSGSSRAATTCWWTRRCRSGSGGSSCSTSPAGGAAWTRSREGASTPPGRSASTVNSASSPRRG
jgi:hypothetical protein